MIKYAYTLFLSILVGFLSCKGTDFALIESGKELRIYTPSDNPEVVNTALEIFGNDVYNVAGRRPLKVEKPQSGILFVGMLGSPETEEFIKTNSVNDYDIRGEWEAFKIICLTTPVYDKPILAVIGSDPRGTAYGILELSRMMGVSPWEWWADVVPEKKGNFTIPVGFEKTDKPSVQFRGIFLNDEDWALVPWASKTFEPSGRSGQIGPETYSKIFELLLRLRANTMWPAMHEKTVPFYSIEGTTEASQMYGIVIGSSHCEPLLCNSAGEWDEATMGRYNFLTNRDAVVNYWESRLQQVSGDDNYFLTIGMRGKHDGKMEGVNTTKEYHDALVEVIKTQRELIAANLKKNPEIVPQAFIPYKEVLEVYDYGLDIPDDVTLIWCDDNYGYLTRLSNEKERERTGGSGVYYHISYWGRPHDYLWLCSTQPAQIYSEMKKAWDYGARKLWILNVGDIKPAEYDIEFFMDMAWNIESVNNDNVQDHLYKWAEREFGTENAENISSVMNEYYRLGMERKPEHMGWSQVEVSGAPRGRTPVKDTEFNPFMFGDEIEKRVAAYEKLERMVDSVSGFISPHRRDAYFQLVKYPVSAASAMNKKLLFAQKARLFAERGLLAANDYGEQSMQAFNDIKSLTQQYNNDVAGGKWNRMMDMRPRELYVFNEPELPEKVRSRKSNTVVWTEGMNEPLSGNIINIPPFLNKAGNSYFISFFSDKNLEWNIDGKPEWLLISEKQGRSVFEKRLDFTADFDKAERTENKNFTLSLNGKKYTVNVEVLILDEDAAGYEYDSMVALNASGFTRVSGETVISGYGHSSGAVLLAPTVNFTDSEPYLEYDIYVTSAGNAKIRTYVLPMHPVNGGDVRIALSVDGSEPQVKSFRTAFRSEEWKLNVMRNQAVVETEFNFLTKGKHTIRLYALDPDIIIDQLMIDFVEDRDFYIVPVE
ncbi:MAG: glycosyl hydrolase 115 family protein [Rikenellaceae bacterium]|nr:glycosyl hydrolase 115 family protein [Rikenellaceae bacterium]